MGTLWAHLALFKPHAAIARAVSMAGHRFQAAQVAKIWGSMASGGHLFRVLASIQATSTSLRQGSCWIRVLPVD